MRTPAHGIMTAAQLLSARPSVIADQEASFLVTAMRCACGVLMSNARKRTHARGCVSFVTFQISNVMDLRDAVDAQLAFMACMLRAYVRFLTHLTAYGAPSRRLLPGRINWKRCVAIIYR